MPRILVLLLAALVPMAVFATGPGYEATYTLTLGPLAVGKMQRSFELSADGQYRFKSKIHATGLASFMRSDELLETSSGRFESGHFYPEAYTYERKNKRKPRSVATTFDRANAVIETLYNGEQRRSEMQDNVLDKLVYQAAMMHDLAAGKTELRYAITDRGRDKVYVPVVAGEEVIKTPAGDYMTIKVIRDRKNDKRRTTFWCAPDLGYLPVQVAHREKNGNETIVTLTAVNILENTERESMTDE